MSGLLKKLLPIILCVIVCPFNGKSQNAFGNLDIGSAEIKNWYDSLSGIENTSLILGTYEDVKIGSLTTHPFYNSYSWKRGALEYRNQVFDNVFMMYNIELDNLVIRHPNFSYANQPIKLIQKQITWFRLEGSFFRLYDFQQPFEEGFYEELFVGENLDVLVHRSKKSTIQANRTDFITYEVSDSYVIRLNDEFHSYKNRRTIIKLMPDLKSEIRKFSRDNQLFLKAGINDQHLVVFSKFIDSIRQL